MSNADDKTPSRNTAGVVVHVHDIFLPFQYPRRWIVEGRYYWAEQYLFHSFLSFLAHNRAFKALFAKHLMSRMYPDAVALFPRYPHRLLGGSSSFWIRRRLV